MACTGIAGWGKVQSTKKVLIYLNGQFGTRMFALDSVHGVESPGLQSSPDLNPLDFSMPKSIDKWNIMQQLDPEMSCRLERLLLKADGFFE
jgi:hypothetical protein